MTRKKRHLLLVEDDDDHRELICRAFDSQAEEMRVTVACTLKEARAALAAAVPDLMITDLELPDGRGIELVPVDMEAAPYPVVIMTGRGNERVAVEAMKAGALDYVIKSEETLANMPHIADSALREWEHRAGRKRAEEALRASEATLRNMNKHLEELVSKRTSDLKQVIIVLENENAHRKAAEQRMRDALSEKEVLLMELHHRIKNNLQLISSMLNLQATSMGSEQALQLARDCDRRLQTMAHVHDQLYDAVNLSQIKLSEYVRQIVNQVMLPNSRFASSIDVIIDTKVESLSVDRSIPCGLLLNELVTNVAKHAFPQPADHASKSERRGELRIECYVDEEERFVLSVSDNGVGLPANVDFDHGTSSGVRLVRALVKQLKGTIAVHRGGGTRVTILFAATLNQSSDNAAGVKPLIQLV